MLHPNRVGLGLSVARPGDRPATARAPPRTQAVLEGWLAHRPANVGDGDAGVMDLGDRARFAFLDWCKAETARLTEIVREQCRSVLCCQDLTPLANVQVDVERGRAKFEFDGLEFEVHVCSENRSSRSNENVAGIHDDETIALYACVNGHDYKIESLVDLGKRLSGVRDQVIGATRADSAP
jgi:hypothetical protein